MFAYPKMITAFIFDLDDTLVQTEHLKALSYARAAHLLAPSLDESTAIDAFKDFVGGSRKDVARGLLHKLGLEEAARARMPEFSATEPWEVFSALRVPIYNAILADNALLEQNIIPGNAALLRLVHAQGYKTGLATMSHREQTTHVLDTLHLSGEFNVVATQENVRVGKPDPEIYNFVARALGVPAAACLVIEDSPTGVLAAQAANMKVIAITTDYSREAFASGALLDRRYVVDDPSTLRMVLDCVLKEN